MKLSLECNISLSKKLRAILGDSGSVNLMAKDLKDGKGVCKLILQNEKVSPLGDGDMPDELKGETSIMITPLTLTKENPPSVHSQEVGSIFATTEPTTGERTVVDRIAAVTPPEQGQLAHAIIAKEEIETPAAFKELEDVECKDFVTNLQELMIEVEKAKHKVADIDVNAIADPRLRAIEQERKEQMESIDKNAFVVNDKAGVLTINDLDLTLNLYSPYDMSNISAKRIASSTEFKSLVKSGYIKFISPDQIDGYTQKAESLYKDHGLEVFDKATEAEANMATVIADGNSSQMIAAPTMDLTESDLTAPTEEERMITDLTKNIGRSTSTEKSSSAVRSSVHGSS